MSVKSSVVTKNGVQYLCVNGEPVEGAAYTTYKRENACYKSFAEKGFRLYSVTLFFGSNYLNETSHLPVFSKGIFDDEIPDYSGFDEDINNILKYCPDAYIFPRINVMPSIEWEKAHADELCDRGTDEFPDNKRACISSDIWADEVKRTLSLFIDHINSMPYRDNIIGYQIAGGNTDEWIAIDFRGNIGKRSEEKFKAAVNNGEYPDTDEGYYRFLSDIVADRLCEFSSFVKEKTNRQLVVGSFYGYTYELCERRFAHHSLGKILNCPDIDFLCSPISYSGQRKAGTNHPYMMPVHSIKLHNKLYFAENDVRTHLTKPVCDNPRYNTPIWFGPEKKKSIEILKMHHARNLTGGHGGWWFDMWGGWYDDDDYMDFLEKARELTKESTLNPVNGVCEAAVFVDENCFAKIADGKGNICAGVRHSLDRCGVPVDYYLASDFEAVKDRYKAYVSLVPCETELTRKIYDYSVKNNIPVCLVDEKNANESPTYFRNFFRQSRLFVYSEKDIVLMANERYIFVHTVCDGEFLINVPEGEELFDAYTGNKVTNTFTAEKGQSFLFEKGRYIK